MTATCICYDGPILAISNEQLLEERKNVDKLNIPYSGYNYCCKRPPKSCVNKGGCQFDVKNDYSHRFAFVFVLINITALICLKCIILRTNFIYLLHNFDYILAVER